MRLSNIVSTRGLILVPIMVVTLLASCVSQKKTKYLQDKQTVQQGSKQTLEKFNVKVKPFDELYIKVNGSDKIESPSTSEVPVSGAMQTSTLFLFSYTVSKEGYINYPVLGKIMVSNLSLDEVSLKISKMLEDYISDPYVSVKFVNNYITILGEVKRPGRYDFTKNKINIFDGLGLAGDLTDYGNGQRVSIIRDIDSTTKVFYIDITNKDVVNSDLFFLQPNDVIYVEPLKAKMWGFTQFPFGIALSLISTTILMLNYFKK